jgi:hypothetical protein
MVFVTLLCVAAIILVAFISYVVVATQRDDDDFDDKSDAPTPLRRRKFRDRYPDDDGLY